MPLPAPRSHDPRHTASRLALAALAASAAGRGASAQEAATVDLPTLTIEASGQGFDGPEFASTAEGVMKSDMPILGDPALGQRRDPGADAGPRRPHLAQALQYTPGVCRRQLRHDNRGDWTLVRGFEPLDLPRRAAGVVRLLQRHQARALPARQRRGAEGPVGDALRQRLGRRRRQPGVQAPRSLCAEHGRARLRHQRPLPGQPRHGGELGPDGRLRYRLVALGRTANGRWTSPATTPRR